MKYLIEKHIPFHPVIRIPAIIPVHSGLSLARLVLKKFGSALGSLKRQPRPFYYHHEQQQFLETYELQKRKFMNSGPPL